MDYDQDGLLDILAGDTRGNITLFRNVGTRQEPKLAEGTPVEADGKAIRGKQKIHKRSGKTLKVDKVIPGSHELAEIYTKINVADWNGDGSFDILVGHTGTIIVYRNVGTPTAPRFAAPELIDVPGKSYSGRPAPYAIDWDKDGKVDLLVCDNKGVRFHKNIGTLAKPKLAEGVPLDLRGDGFDVGYRNRIAVVDWNNDNKRDLLVGNYYSSKRPSAGNIWLFLAE